MPCMVLVEYTVYDQLCVYLENTLFICYKHMHEMCLLSTLLGYIGHAVENIINRILI